jgi:ubiquinone/menaquinone biosynthesis C-methylase UbiE
VSDKYKSVDYDVVTSPVRRWWNAYWDVWTFVINLGVQGKSVLVMGCGAGEDALYFAKLGAKVSAFDLSPDMLAHGIKLAQKDGLTVSFDQMPAEKLHYPDDTFDLVFARDILHHVEIPIAMMEIVRVTKPGGLFIVNEIYSHSVTELIRRSWLVEHLLYPAMKNFIYKGTQPYITHDERKMNEIDITSIKYHLEKEFQYHKFFNFLITRLVPDKYPFLSKIDRIALICLGTIGGFVAGRIACVGRFKKRVPEPQLVGTSRGAARRGLASFRLGACALARGRLN